MPQWGGGPKCGSCERTVYAQEKIDAGKLSFHKGCFKCSVCSMNLTALNYGQADKVLFCKKHYQSTVVARNAQVVS